MVFPTCVRDDSEFDVGKGCQLVAVEGVGHGASPLLLLVEHFVGHEELAAVDRGDVVKEAEPLVTDVNRFGVDFAFNVGPRVVLGLRGFESDIIGKVCRKGHIYYA